MVTKMVHSCVILLQKLYQSGTKVVRKTLVKRTEEVYNLLRFQEEVVPMQTQHRAPIVVSVSETTNEIGRDEARHGKALKGLLDRYFGE